MEKIKRNIVEDVPHELTEAEAVERGHQLAQCMLDVEHEDAEHKEAARAHKLRKAELVKRVKALHACVHTGVEYRPTECRWVFDEAERKAFLYRAGTGELVRDRAMTDEELEALRQGELFDDDAGDGLEAGAVN